MDRAPNPPFFPDHTKSHTSPPRALPPARRLRPALIDPFRPSPWSKPPTAFPGTPPTPIPGGRSQVQTNPNSSNQCLSLPTPRAPARSAPERLPPNHPTTLPPAHPRPPRPSLHTPQNTFAPCVMRSRAHVNAKNGQKRAKKNANLSRLVSNGRKPFKNGRFVKNDGRIAPVRGVIDASGQSVDHPNPSPWAFQKP